MNLGKNQDSSATEKKEGATTTAAENHAKELFMCGQHDMFAIGGGSVKLLILKICVTAFKIEQGSH